MNLRLALPLFSFLLLAPRLSAAPSPAAFSVEVTGQGPPVILIPGLACSGAVWAPTVARYRASHELHVLTLAGFAGQTPVQPPLLAKVRAQLADYIRDRKLARPIVVGHSLGGFVALWLAATAPDLVGGLVIIDAFPFMPASSSPDATVASVRSRALWERTRSSQEAPKRYAAESRAALATWVSDPRHIEPLAAMWRQSDQKVVAGAFYELRTTDLRPALPRVRTPTLVLAAGKGAGDAVRALFAAQYARLRGARIEVAPWAHHYLFIDDPSFFFAQLDRVLK